MEIVRSAIQTITACCLNCREEDTRPGEPTERTPLFAAEQQRRTISPRRISEDEEINNEYANSLPKRDEQTALNRIVQETNS